MAKHIIRNSHSETILEKVQDDIVNFLNEKYSGSGIDSGYQTGNITSKSMYIESSFHCMDENGFYDGWQHFAIVIPLFECWDGWKLIFRHGSRRADKYQLREYLEDSVHNWLKAYYEGE